MKNQKNKLTTEEIELQSVKNCVSDYTMVYNNIIKNKLNHLLPTEKNIFIVGEKVIIGNLRDCVIHEVYCNGYFYVVDYTKSSTRETPTKLHTKGVWYYDDIKKINNNENIIFTEDKLYIQYYNTTISSCIHDWFRGELVADIKYQRDYCWLLEDKQALINSILNNYEIGRVLLKKYHYTGSTETNDLTYHPGEIIDGKQRLSTICEFIQNKFPIINGLYWNDMTIRDRDVIENYKIMIAEVDADINEVDLAKLFIKINTTGKVMDKEHIEAVKKLYSI